MMWKLVKPFVADEMSQDADGLSQEEASGQPKERLKLLFPLTYLVPLWKKEEAWRTHLVGYTLCAAQKDLLVAKPAFAATGSGGVW